jgi:hypothetical protein
MHLIIDADPIVYRCGFAAETPTYHLVMEGEAGVYEAVFEPYDGQTAGTRMQKWVQDHPEDTLLEKQKVVYPEPESHAHEAVRTQLYSIEKECRNHFAVDGFDSIRVILSGPGNYRNAIATVFPYKGNRDPEHKPHWYQSIRNYLTGDWGASVVHGREADDECSIIARQLGYRDCVIATIDKDLDQIPGEHYNYLKQVFYAQSEYDASVFFWQQILSGDATDGVPGCYRVGVQRAAAIIAELIDFYPGVPSSARAGGDGAGASGAAGLRVGFAAPAVFESDLGPGAGGGATEHSAATGHQYMGQRNSAGAIPRGIWEGIVRQYEISKGRNGCTYVARSAEAVALETARLVYLQQNEGELWIPTGPPHDLLEAYKDE